MTHKLIVSILLLATFNLGFLTLAAAKSESGSLILIGDVLRHNEYSIWQRIHEVAGGGLADFVVIATANPRPDLYGAYAVRALQRYGAIVDQLPANDPAIVDRIREASAVFFVGGVPQRLASVMYSPDNSMTALGKTVRKLFADGGTIIGGIPAEVGVATNIDSFSALQQGSYAEQDFYPGLGLLDDDWYVDQHFFYSGRFAQSLIAMNQLGKTYALGIGANTAALINHTQLEVLGKGGVMLVDLSRAASATDKDGFSISGVRLSYLDQGDRLDMTSLEVAAHPNKLAEFEVLPDSDATVLREKKIVINDLFSEGNLLKSLIAALESEREQVEGIVLNQETGLQTGGFVFRFYTGSDSIGWLTTMFGGQRWTVLNIYMDISTLAGES